MVSLRMSSELQEQVKAAAGVKGQTVTGWLIDAAGEKLRREHRDVTQPRPSAHTAGKRRAKPPVKKAAPSKPVKKMASTAAAKLAENRRAQVAPRFKAPKKS